MFHFCRWRNRPASDIVWPCETPDSFLSLTALIQLLSAPGLSFFFPLLSALRPSFLQSWPPHLQSLSTQRCGVMVSGMQCFSLQCFRHGPAFSRYRIHFVAQYSRSFRTLLLLTLLVYLPSGPYTCSLIQLLSTICYFLKTLSISFGESSFPSFSLFLTSSFSIMEFIP